MTGDLLTWGALALVAYGVFVGDEAPALVQPDEAGLIDTFRRGNMARALTLADALDAPAAELARAAVRHYVNGEPAGLRAAADGLRRLGYRELARVLRARAFDYDHGARPAGSWRRDPVQLRQMADVLEHNGFGRTARELRTLADRIERGEA